MCFVSVEGTAERATGIGSVLVESVSKGCSSTANYGAMVFFFKFNVVLKPDMAAVKIFRLLSEWYVFL